MDPVAIEGIGSRKFRFLNSLVPDGPRLTPTTTTRYSRRNFQNEHVLILLWRGNNSRSPSPSGPLASDTARSSARGGDEGTQWH
ncbi:hypothetical protein BDM02DRAFT_3113036 [Thelephora ganbajun]|uniref:Uncharacterized protein n=1 Tax=Thelephora ganbajun TaxID=370292 RepID=A0ACB6ZJQ7_THEGA|nr:hypothetical protein BDM02DRAFT_3113036 [Thelephora ganbajun]